MKPPLLQLDSIEKSFFGVRVLKDVRLTLEAGSVLGLVGENGAGKSTLMNILGGVIAADQGSMSLEGHAYQPRGPADAAASGIALIHQELNLFSNLTAAENLFLADFPTRAGVWINRRQLRERVAAVLQQVDPELDPETLVARLSPGERQLVEIAKGLHARARVLVLDEPTTSLTEPECQRLFEIIRRLRQQGIGIIYISHNLGHVQSLCDRIVVLRDGEVQIDAEASELSLEAIVTHMVGRSIEQLFPPREARPSDRVALAVRGLSSPGTLYDVSFTLRRGEVLGISGLMGAGRTELLRTLFGLDGMSGGRIQLDGQPLRPSPRDCIRRGMALVTEERHHEGLLMDAPVGDNLVLASLRQFVRGGLFQHRHAASRVARIAGRVSLACRDTHRQPVRTLSGGNQQKVVLGKWLLTTPKVFLLDEPTRGVDVGAKAEIYRLINELAAGGAGVLMVSSELEELLGMCDRILVLAAGTLRGEVHRQQFHREDIMRLALGEERLG